MQPFRFYIIALAVRGKKQTAWDCPMHIKREIGVSTTVLSALSIRWILLKPQLFVPSFTKHKTITWFKNMSVYTFIHFVYIHWTRPPSLIVTSRAAIAGRSNHNYPIQSEISLNGCVLSSANEAKTFAWSSRDAPGGTAHDSSVFWGRITTKQVRWFYSWKDKTIYKHSETGNIYKSICLVMYVLGLISSFRCF